MTLTARPLAHGDGWQASDMLCRAGPDDAAFEEQHGAISVAIVLEGSFDYRSTRGGALLAPGAILLGNAGDCFECGHSHSVGDRCLAFQFSPVYFEGVAAAVPGVTRLAFDRAALPSQAAGADLLMRADRLCEAPGGAEAFACILAARLVAALHDRPPIVQRTRRATARVQEVVHWLEQEAPEPQSLAGLARMACLSPYHFLREFKHLVGMTPHQFLLALRLRRAAALLCHEPQQPILQVAMDAGFSDLSEFNRRFRRVLGETPRSYRARHRQSGGG